MRAAVVIVLVTAAVSSGCAPMYAGRSGWYPQMAPTQVTREVSGRWDNVMMLPAGSRVHVLLLDGGRAEGTLRSASVTALNLAVASGEIEIAVDRVARVDRTTGQDRTRKALSGAVHGAGAVGLIGLLTGHAPPGRVFAAGAILGADAGVHSVPAGAETIYLAPQLGR